MKNLFKPKTMIKFLRISLIFFIIVAIAYLIVSRFVSPMNLYRMQILGKIFISLVSSFFLLLGLMAVKDFKKISEKIRGLRLFFLIITFCVGLLILFNVSLWGFSYVKEVIVDDFGNKTKTIKDKVSIRTECNVSCSRTRYVREYVRTFSDGKDYPISHHLYLNQLKKHLDVKYFGEIEIAPKELPGLYCLKVLENSSRLIQVDRCDN